MVPATMLLLCALQMVAAVMVLWSHIANGSCDAVVVHIINGSYCDAFVVRTANGMCWDAFVVSVSNGSCCDALVVCTANVSWALRMWISNVNFMRAEHCKNEVYENWAKQCICECEFMRNEHYECEFHESRALRMWIFQELSISRVNLWELSIANMEFLKSWALQFWIFL